MIYNKMYFIFNLSLSLSWYDLPLNCTVIILGGFLLVFFIVQTINRQSIGRELGLVAMAAYQSTNGSVNKT